MHKCDNKLCCNPNHMDLGSYADNNKDAALKGRSRAPRGSQHAKAKLTKEEDRILKSFESDDWVPESNFLKRKKELMQYARTTLKKDKRLNIRISERDLVEIQRKAVKEGLPYQTYVSSILHKFINGALIEAK